MGKVKRFFIVSLVLFQSLNSVAGEALFCPSICSFYPANFSYIDTASENVSSAAFVGEIQQVFPFLKKPALKQVVTKVCHVKCCHAGSVAIVVGFWVPFEVSAGAYYDGYKFASISAFLETPLKPPIAA